MGPWMLLNMTVCSAYVAWDQFSLGNYGMCGVWASYAVADLAFIYALYMGET